MTMPETPVKVRKAVLQVDVPADCFQEGFWPQQNWALALGAQSTTHILAGNAC